MLSWIPVIGPIIEGLFSIWTKSQDTALAKYQTTTNADVEDAKTAANIIQVTQDDIGVRFMRDIVCFPVVVWSGLIGWDTIIAYRYPWLQFHVANYPDSVAYLPYAVIVFLLGNIGINAYKRK